MKIWLNLVALSLFLSGPALAFDCADGSSIPDESVCDGVDDCDDGADELNCEGDESTEGDESAEGDESTEGDQNWDDFYDGGAPDFENMDGFACSYSCPSGGDFCAWTTDLSEENCKEMAESQCGEGTAYEHVAMQGGCPFSDEELDENMEFPVIPKSESDDGGCSQNHSSGAFGMGLVFLFLALALRTRRNNVHLLG